MGVGVGQVLRQAALRWPGQLGLVEAASGGTRRWSYDAVDLSARRVAGELSRRGLDRSRIGLLAPNGEAFVRGFFGILYAGGTVVPLSPLSVQRELQDRLAHARCAAVLAPPAQLPLADGCGLPTFSLAEREAAAPVRFPVDPAPEAAAMILYTSGTTGRPRGVVLSHAALLAHTATLVHHTLGLGPADRVLGVLPLTHSFGCRMVMLAGLFAGAAVVLVPRFEARATLRLLEEERITWAPVVPTMLAAWARLPGLAPTTLRWCLSAAAPLPRELALRAEARLGCEVRQGYGMTEATFSTVNAPPDPRVLGSVGRPAWGVEVRIVDAQGQDLPPGAEGEILVRGPNLMSGYLDEPEATAEALGDGWMRSGDLGRVDGEGRLFVLDRLKDLILRGGHSVYPAEVEEALASHPAVAQVAVVGRPDAYLGEEVVAVVVPRAGSRLAAEKLIDWARERVSRFKYPREVAFVEALPTGPSGKVLRRTLREQLASGLLRVERSAREPGFGEPGRADPG